MLGQDAYIILTRDVVEAKAIEMKCGEDVMELLLN